MKKAIRAVLVVAVLVVAFLVAPASFAAGRHHKKHHKHGRGHAHAQMR